MTAPRRTLSGTFRLALPYAAGAVIVLLMTRGWLQDASVRVVGSTELCEGTEPTPAGESFVDAVCRMRVGTSIAAVINEELHYFCTERCRDLFSEDPSRFLAETCIVCRADGTFRAVRSDLRTEWQGTLYRFCAAEHRAAFRADPGGYFLHTMWGIPSWLYYTSIALILAASFFFFEKSPGGAKRAAPVRVDLLAFAPLRWLVMGRYTRPVAQLSVVAVFLLIIVAGLFGNQLPSKNIAPLLTWTIWWGGLVVVILWLGKAFCYACPWDALAGWVESLRFWGPKKKSFGLELKSPRAWQHIWLAILMFVLLTWIELGLGVTLKPRATAYMALGMLGLAVVCALVFERKYFCRNVCLVGRISGLYALFAPFEVRARDESVCRTCTTHSCYKGNDQGLGCPTHQFPGTMANNTYCTLCMECMRTCEPGNMTIRARPWGEDLEHVRHPRLDEAFLALSLLALSAFHGLTMTGVWRQLTASTQEVTGLGRIAVFSLWLFVLTAVPTAIYALFVEVSRRLAGADSPSFRTCFIRYAYTLLPVALFYHLAHNAEHLLMEGQKIVSLVSDPFGRQWDLFGTATRELPPVASLTTLWAVQVFLVLVGHVYGVWAASRVTARLYTRTRTRLAAHLPLLVIMILFSLLSLWLLKQPMEMRSSGM